MISFFLRAGGDVAALLDVVLFLLCVDFFFVVPKKKSTATIRWQSIGNPVDAATENNFLKKMNLCIEFFKKYGVPLSTPALVLFLAKVYLVLPSFLQGNLVLTYFYPI